MNDNFADPRSPRSLRDDPIAYKSGSIFSVGVALYDPFAHWRKSAAVDAFIEDMLALGSHWQTELARLLERAV